MVISTYESKDKLIDRLEKVYSQVTEYSKFADTKNALLITFNLALLAGLNQIIGLSFSTWVEIVIICIVLVSTIVAVVAIFPSLKSSKKTNPIYFGNISSYSTYDFFEKEIYRIEDDSYYIEQLNEQIYIVSKITSRKFLLFKIAFYTLTIIGIVYYILGRKIVKKNGKKAKKVD